MVTPTSGPPLDPQRRAALLRIKLHALVRDHVGELDDASPGPPLSFGRGAALIHGRTAWLLLDEQPERSLGAALAWLGAQGAAADELALITDAASGVLSRRAALFGTPISVWHAMDRLLVPAVAEPYPSAAIDPAHEQLRALIVEAGAEPVEENGVLSGEVRGLEVCRAVTDSHTGEVRLEVGVGAHDREAFLMLHGGRPTVEALADVVATVSRHRQIGADPHPLNRLGAERLLRWMSIAAPERIGAASLQVAAPPVVRANLKDPVPCVAVGESRDGRALVAVYSTGIDLDLVPFGVDAREMHHPDAQLLLVVPERDASPVTKNLAAQAKHPAAVVPWTSAP